MLGIAKDPLQHTSMYQRLSEDSEDSEGEGGLGNVSRVIIRPAGVSGKAKKGHLCFDAAFETGNLGKAELVGEFEYDLYLRPDTCNPRYRFWFNFTVDNVKQDQRVLFHIVNLAKSRNLFASGLVPLVKSTSRPKWQRLPQKYVFYYRSSLHQNHYVLSFAFVFDKEDEVYQFAVAPPYSYSRLQSYLSIVEQRQRQSMATAAAAAASSSYFTRTTISKSLQNRNIDLITIDQVSGRETGSSSGERHFIRVIFILCRIHGCDGPASYLCQGFMEFLLSNHRIAQILRENFVFKIVPMINPDGVFLGNNRCNLVGQDMNRSWHLANEFIHPEIYSIKKILKEIDNSENYQIDFVIDLHSNNSLHGCFIYGNTYEDVYRYERHLVFPRLFASNAPDYASQHTIFNADEKKIGTSRRYFCERLSETVNSYTLEISMGGHYLKDGKTMTLYTEEGYYRCGRNLARTFLHYYRFINILPMPLSKEVKSGKKRRSKTHQSRSRRYQRYVVEPRPTTTRSYAPISYTNLSICYDDSGGSSILESNYTPLRNYRMTPGGSSHFSGHQKTNLPTTTTMALWSYPPLNDQYLSFLRLRGTGHPEFYNTTTGFGSMYYHQQTRQRSTHASMERPPPPSRPQTVGAGSDQVAITVPPKPYLSIIDLNQLTRGSFQIAKGGGGGVGNR